MKVTPKRISSGQPGPLNELEGEIVSCRRCPRLVVFREEAAQTKKKQFIQWNYWGRPVPGFGDPNASLLLVGLAPAPHGGNRTGRVFTGDRSGDFLTQALYKAGFANQPTSESRDDGLRLEGAYLTAAVKCAPPDNKPTPSEIGNCSRFLDREFDLLRNVRAILCLGHIAYRSTFERLKALHHIERPTPKFRHGLELNLGEYVPRVFASYHPSPRNTQTGKLTEHMFLSLVKRIHRTLSGPELAKPGTAREGSQEAEGAS